MGGVLAVLNGGVAVLVNNNILPLVSVFVEPAKVLFLNNAINHGIFTPLGAEQVATAGKSIFYMIETNPGAGTGVLVAYWLFAKDKVTKDSAPGALIVHLLGGIHEIYFPYVLMNPLLLLATIGGSVAAMIFNTAFKLGLAGPPSPGSIIAYVGMAPKGSTFMVLLSVVVAAAVSFVIAAPIIRLSNSKATLEDSTAQMKEMKAQSKGVTADEIQTVADTLTKVSSSDIKHIVFACDAGMGSSAMGATVLRKKLSEVGRTDIEVKHASVSEIPAETQIVVTHQDLAARARKSAPGARVITISNFMSAPEYDQLAEELKA
jgi:PTS system mannitol-specific IIC component